MGATIHRNFSTTSEAEAAHSALLAAGFRPAAVKLNSHQIDPASVSAATDFVSNVIDKLTPDGKPAAAAKPSPASLLTVDTDDDEQQAQAAAIMARHGGSEA